MVRSMSFTQFFIRLLFLIFSLSSCISANKKSIKSQLSQQQITEMEQALSLLKEKEFSKAGLIYDRLALSLKENSAKTLMLFNAGVSYKENRECEKALLRQRSALDLSLKIPDFRARSLLELSYIYECLGKAELALISLKDLQKNRSALPWSWNHILYPARMSLAFARLGDIKQADKYKSMSLQKILEYKQTFKDDKKMKENISEIFYLMGRSYVQIKNIKAPAFGQSFFYHQLFLLQALFLEDKTWSPLAKKELNLLFDKLIIALPYLKDKKTYKENIQTTLKTGKTLIEKEKNKKWLAFYNKKSNLILKLLSKQ